MTVDGGQDRWKTKTKTRALTSIVSEQPLSQLITFGLQDFFTIHLGKGRGLKYLEVLLLWGMCLGVVTNCIPEDDRGHFYNGVEWEVLLKVVIKAQNVFPYWTDQWSFIEQYS